MAGRLVGVSIDSQGQPAYRLTLQTREQHIRREKATSNICTAQVLLAVMASMYAVYHGPDGLARIARRVHRLTVILAEGLRRVGLQVNGSYFDTLTVGGVDAAKIHAAARAAGINLREFSSRDFGERAGQIVGIALDETATRADVQALWKLFGVAADVDALDREIDAAQEAAIPAGLRRTTPFLTHPVFNAHHSEHEMLRYMRSLADKDLALDRTMIPLGSCTMKLNATSEMIPVTWPEFANIHPLAPADQTAGYRQLIAELEQMLVECTGYDAVSLQPNSGAQGEYAGLLAIRAYHRSRGEGHRNICLIPESAHGTNPASAQLCGMEVVAVKTDRNGNVDVTDLAAKADQHAANLAALMVTYPSTHGVFEEAIVDICRIIHAHGGQVYTDGANLNALVGVAKPGKYGSDVSHLNLHKTFCIPHGGGGPGVGPVAVKAHLAPFLPGTLGRDNKVGMVSAADFGSASILPIPWMYITMMGAAGLRKATQVALLNANYVAKRLAPHYPTLYAGRNGYVAHECILDLRPLKDVERHFRRGCGQAPDGLRLPCADAELPGGGHADGRADRERAEGRARSLHRRDDRDPRGDPRGGGGQGRPRRQPAQERTAHRGDGDGGELGARLHARARRLPRGIAQAPEVLDSGGQSRQRLRRPQHHVFVRADVGVRRTVGHAGVTLHQKSKTAARAAVLLSSGVELALHCRRRLDDLCAAHRFGGDQRGLVIIGQCNDAAEENQGRRNGCAQGHCMLEVRVRHDVFSCSGEPDGGSCL